MGVSPKTGPPKFKLFTLLSKVHEIFKVSKQKRKKKLTKFGGTKMGGHPSTTPKNSNFLTTYARHMKFSE